MKKGIMLGLLPVLFFSGCMTSKPSKDKNLEANKNKVDNSQICITDNFKTIPNCKNGEIIAFLPNSWGNEQLPLYFIALHCNFNHQIIYNNGGVICVYTDKRNRKMLEGNNQQR